MMTYDSYKASQTAWMGEVPKHWKLEKAKWHFTLRNERGNENPVLLAATQKNGMYPQDKVEGVVKVAEGTDVQQFRTVHKNDFVISLRSFQGGFERSDYEGVCSPAYQVFYSDGAWNDDYLRYLFKSEPFIDAMNALTVGIREGRNIKYEDFANSILAIPPIEEQKGIAYYLDKKVSYIDSLISEAKASIEEYKSWKASIIYEAVTKGLDTNVEMKDSGVEWIGKIPVGWNIITAKFLVNINHGSDPKTEGNIPVYGSGANSFKTCGEYKEGPVVLIGRKGATLHIPHYIEGRFWNVDTAFDVTARDDTLNLKLYYYLAICFDYKYYMSQTTLPSMTQSNYNSMKLPVPKKDEQTRIVAHLDNVTQNIDTVISEKESLIADLEAYKKSLIFEVVTGKRQVV